MSQLVTIGSVEAPHDIVQSRYADFRWSVEFFEGDTDEAPLDLTGYTFEMQIFPLSGATPIAELEIGSGISVSSNVVTFAINIASWEDWTKGCKLPYRVRMTTSGSVVKPLFKGSFMLT